MKKLFALMMVSAFALAFVACGGKKADAEKAKADSLKRADSVRKADSVASAMAAAEAAAKAKADSTRKADSVAAATKKK